MIVTCEQCSTQFRLDDAKVPETGARVRCSKCKHAFFIQPASKRSDTLAAADLAEEAMRGGRDEDALEDSDWQFNEEAQPPLRTDPAPGGGRDAASAAVDDLLGPDPLPAAAPGATAAPPEATPLESPELGSPEDWDLLDESEPSPSSAIGRVELVPRPYHSLEEGHEASADEDLSDRLAVAAELDRPGPSGAGRLAGAVAQACGWLVTSTLIGMLAHGVLRGVLDAPAAATEIEVSGLRAGSLRARWVENAVAGPLYVLSGELRSDRVRAAGPALAARVVDAQGGTLQVSPLGPAFDDRALREAEPDQLVQAQQRAARSFAQLHPGESFAFQALFSGLPPSAARVLLEAQEP